MPRTTIEYTTLTATNQSTATNKTPNASKPTSGQQLDGLVNAQRTSTPSMQSQRRRPLRSDDHDVSPRRERLCHKTTSALSASTPVVSRSLELSFQSSLQLSPHGTCLLSNSYSYLALDDGYHPTLDCTFKQPDSKAQHIHRPRERSYGACTL